MNIDVFKFLYKNLQLILTKTVIGASKINIRLRLNIMERTLLLNFIVTYQIQYLQLYLKYIIPNLGFNHWYIMQYVRTIVFSHENFTLNILFLI